MCAPRNCKPGYLLIVYLVIYWRGTAKVWYVGPCLWTEKRQSFLPSPDPGTDILVRAA
ncbi:hypothetical protein BDW42DRAFT_167663 [Aspergillus taichungensis]|uniref:Uncharacterized protein n=1 Tax=Aspergillus taichungensis TaxID=482145 RepID=A0A2J5HX15_9EURO|nr:hypothetical protein BDW42DRAFT_167663 [Aspergillus taichungensis]